MAVIFPYSITVTEMLGHNLFLPIFMYSLFHVFMFIYAILAYEMLSVFRAITDCFTRSRFSTEFIQFQREKNRSTGEAVQ